MSTGDDKRVYQSRQRLMSMIQLSLLSDNAHIPETAYDDLYIVDGWKRSTFRRYRQATDLSPLSFLRPNNRVEEIHRIYLDGKEKLRAKQSLQKCCQTIQELLSPDGSMPTDSMKTKLLGKCKSARKCLESTESPELLNKEVYKRQQDDLESTYFQVFKRRLSIGSK